MHTEAALLLVLVQMTSQVLTEAHRYYDYIIVGAGPSGLQMGYFLQSAKRDYVVLERGNASGTFFKRFPRHDKLISINKRYTGKTNKEFNLRHDWNSLLSNDESLLYKHYSEDFFPHRDTMLTYLNDYEHKLGLSVHHNVEVKDINQIPADDNGEGQGSARFTFKDQDGNIYTCRSLIMATGMSKPYQPVFEGSEHMEGYENISVDPDDFRGQNVLILGKGNSAFEVADRIIGSTNYIHLLGRDRIRLSWATHYVGDLRAINNALLDTYQLKSLDGLLDGDVESIKLTKHGDKISLLDAYQPDSEVDDNSPTRMAYDRVIRALGFTFDDSVFHNQTKISRFETPHGPTKFPHIGYAYQSRDVSGMYVIGTASHSLDYRKSSGGFIHGFRYTVRTLHRLLEWKEHHIPWPVKEAPIGQLLPTLIKRINEVSGLYQMYGVLCDVIIFKNDHSEFEILEEYPTLLLHELPGRTGRGVSDILVFVLQYGPDFSGPNADVFRIDRAVGEPTRAHESNFLHPVLYYYKTLPTLEAMRKMTKKELLPRPDAIHHIVEDFHATWDGSESHILPTRRFIEDILDKDMTFYIIDNCFQMMLMNHTQPHMCDEYYSSGHGILQAALF